MDHQTNKQEKKTIKRPKKNEFNWKEFGVVIDNFLDKIITFSNNKNKSSIRFYLFYAALYMFTLIIIFLSGKYGLIDKSTMGTLLSASIGYALGRIISLFPK